MTQLMMLPPAGFPPLMNIPGSNNYDSAIVEGYWVGDFVDTYSIINPEGRVIHPGDKGFYDTQLGRLGLAPIPKGYRIVSHTAQFLYAKVQGNPVLLEQSARKLGYKRALAISPNCLKLTEMM